MHLHRHASLRRTTTTPEPVDSRGYADRLTEAELGAIFRRYDSNGDHFLEPTEVEGFLEEVRSSSRADAVLRGFDLNRDGRLSFDEFAGMYTSCVHMRDDVEASGYRAPYDTEDICLYRTVYLALPVVRLLGLLPGCSWMLPDDLRAHAWSAGNRCVPMIKAPAHRGSFHGHHTAARPMHAGRTARGTHLY